MELDEYDIATLKSIVNGIEKTIEIMDLYFDSNDVIELNRIIKKVKRE